MKLLFIYLGPYSICHPRLGQVLVLPSSISLEKQLGPVVNSHYLFISISSLAQAFMCTSLILHQQQALAMGEKIFFTITTNNYTNNQIRAGKVMKMPTTKKANKFDETLVSAIACDGYTGLSA